MASARLVLEKLRSSDGRIRIKTLSGVSVLVAVIALLVGVLPVLADHAISKVTPVVIDEGGGSGKCSVETGGLPSVAGNEFHINNPTPGLHSNGIIAIRVEDTNQGRVFDLDVVTGAGMVVYDVIVNGGAKSNHYDYDDRGSGPVTDDDDLHAPRKNRTALHNLSHINICYDVPGLVSFACDMPEMLEGEGLITAVQVTIFDNSLHGCTDKGASFTLESDIVTLEFDGEGTVIVAGRMEFEKDFVEDPFDGPADFADLQYRHTADQLFEDVEWCAVRAKAAGDGSQFVNELGTTSYPSLVGVTDAFGDAITCKVYEEEDATGIQYTVVYFELEDPQWR